MTTIPMSEASSRLDDLVDQLAPGEEIELTRGNDTVARLVKNGSQKQTRRFGLGKGKLTIVADDDEHLEHFQDYMP
ncbi:MAG: type II toxin-antitoxin system Phd/YefM family antitoxin [Planctomycetota bacterium]|nr:type II toxin-antitoxin system Phd/YefM family antitoxin [Planctomycetota bacterium]